MSGHENEAVAVEVGVSDLQECRACSTKFQTNEIVKLRCSHGYCHGCLEKIFKTAMKDETMWPARCCGSRIPAKLARKLLSTPLMSRFRARRKEFSVKNRTYCHRVACSAFIAPHSIHNGQAICQRCRSVTCNNCKNPFHFGPCNEGDDAAFFELVRATRWKRCPDCKRIVEKNDGCNHMICRCGSEWCYGCGEDFNACSCGSESDVSAEEAIED